MTAMASPSRLADAYRTRHLARIAEQAPDPSRDNLAAWAETKRGFTNAGHHREWYGLVQTRAALCLLAPRDSAKSECLTVNNAAWRVIHNPGFQVFVFAATDGLAMGLKRRIDDVIEQVAPHLIDGCPARNDHRTELNNGAWVRAAGAGTAVRGAHPDLLVGDDVLTEDGCRTHEGRQKMASWWFGTVEGMRHPGATPRRVEGRTYTYPPTRVVLCGTPFHADDLLMSMKSNGQYVWRRYASEFHDTDRLPGSWAIEANDLERAA